MCRKGVQIGAIIGCFLVCFFSYAQTTLTEVKTKSGSLIVNKSADSYVVFGFILLTEPSKDVLRENGWIHHKGRINLVFDKSCHLVEVQIKEDFPTESLTRELKNFAEEILKEIQERKLEYLFQHSNESDFVTEGSCAKSIHAFISLLAT